MPITRRRVVPPRLCAAALVLLTGCAHLDYYVVETRIVERTQDESRRDVFETPSFLDTRGRVRTIALRAPTECRATSASEATGDTVTAGVLASTRCGIWMGELERAYAQRGFTVVSWKIIEDEAALGNAPAAVAQRLGAQVLLVVNSLEPADALPGREARIQRNFHRSSARGEMGEPAPVPELRARRLDFLARPHEETLLSRHRLGVTVDVTALSLESGHTVWFYRGNLLEAQRGSRRETFLVVCTVQGCDETPRPAPGANQRPNGTRTGGSESISERREIANIDSAVRFRLVRALLGDLTDTFAGRVRSQQEENAGASR